MALLVRRAPSPAISHFRAARPHLRLDCGYACAYCGIAERENGGDFNFHVEHFKPRGKFPSDQHDYANLLYACAFCNLTKGSCWYPGDPLTTGQGFLDPCVHDYEDIFSEDAGGKVYSKCQAGAFMIERLHLNSPFLVALRQDRSQLRQAVRDATEAARLAAEILVHVGPEGKAVASALLAYAKSYAKLVNELASHRFSPAPPRAG